MSSISSEAPTDGVPSFVYPWSVVSVLLSLGLAGYIFLGSLLTTMVLLAGFIALFGWSRTTLRAPAAPAIIVVYILAIIAMMVHQFEQWFFGYPAVMTSMFPSIFAAPVSFSETIYIALFSYGALTWYLFAGVGVYQQKLFGNYVAWFVFVWAIVGGLSCYVLPLMSATGYHYLPGMATAPLPVALGVYGIRRILQGHHEVAESSVSRPAGAELQEVAS